MNHNMIGAEYEEMLRRREVNQREAMLIGLMVVALSAGAVRFIFGYLAHEWLS